ncbi:MAG TPA: hypothetical protein VJY39_20595 [Acidisphaera sp.]|nr:hypothetical protein [Acidisphaera sp.]
MARVFVSEATGAAVYVFADDHCPPHVHTRHRGEGWIARVGFSYTGSTVELISIAPLSNVPLPRVVNRLLDDVRAELPACRRSWWAIRQTTCVENRWCVLRAGGIEMLKGRVRGAKQIAGAWYDPAREWLHLTFRDGTTADVSIGQ